MQDPAQHDLARALAVACADLGKLGMLEDLAACDRRIGRERDAERVGAVHQPGLVEQRVKLDLIGDDGGVEDRRRVAQHRDRIVRHADIPRQPAVMGLLQQFQRGGVFAAHGGPVEQQHVNMVDLQILQALLDRGHEQRFGEIVGMHLGRDAELLARQAGGGERGAGFDLVAIHLRGVDGAVADIQCGLDRLERCVAGQWIGSERALVGSLKVDVHRCLPGRARLCNQMVH